MGNLQLLSKTFQAMGHPVRLQILQTLALKPVCVCDLVAILDRRQAYISQHLALLRQADLVRCSRDGWNVFYRLNAIRFAEVTQYLRPFCQPVDDYSKLEKCIGEQKMSENNHNNGAWHGIPREQINWHPTVVSERCIGCGLCATSCNRGVFAFDYTANRPVVVGPQLCMVGCTTCATICTQDALEFPSQGYIRQVIKKNKVVTQAKNMLKADPAKYDIKARLGVTE